MISYGLKSGEKNRDQWKLKTFFRLANRVYVLSVYNLVIFICFTTMSSIFKEVA